MTPLGDIDEDDVAFDAIWTPTPPTGADIPAGDPGAAPAAAAGPASRPASGWTSRHRRHRRRSSRPNWRGCSTRSTPSALICRDLDRLVPEEFARHWQITLDFLRPIARLWQADAAQPKACIDPADRRDRLLAAQAAAWRRLPACSAGDRRRLDRQHAGDRELWR